MKKLLLVDGNSLLYRAYYAFNAGGVNLSHDGMPTHATYGFLNMLFRALEDIKPTHLAVCFDIKGKTFRHDLFTEYKATRKPTPEDLVVQLGDTKQLLTELGISVIQKQNYEADDLIGTLSRQIPSVILTADRDAFQLISDTVELNLTKSGVAHLDKWTLKRVKDEYGITPSQMIDLKALVGDTSDNIPGAKGIGDKGALVLIQEWGSIENIYENLLSVKESIRKKLEDSRDLVFKSKELATINIDVDVEVGDLTLNFPFPSTAKQSFERRGFRSMLNKKGLWKDTEMVTVNTRDEIDTIKNLPSPVRIAWDKDFVYVGDYQIRILANLLDGGVDEGEIWKSLKPVLEGKIGKIVSDSKALKEKSIKISNIVGDERIANHLKGSSEELYKEIELPLVDVLIEMQQHGMVIDMVALNQLSGEFKDEIDILSAKIYGIAGEVFNINSPQQLGDVLFTKLGLKAIEKTKTGYSTNEEVLLKLKDFHPIIEPILRYRKLQKLYSTYIQGYAKLADENGFVYTTFNNTGTVTGRLSSSEPNIQNIPPQIRSLFKSRFPDGSLVCADYSQIELRILAHLSGDEVMINAFSQGRDIHQETADAIGCRREEAKAINFGIIYGMSSFGLSESLGVKPHEAAKFIERYFAQFPKIKEFLDGCVQYANLNGHIETMMGRRRYFSKFDKFAERAAMNMPMQGGAADIIKKAMLAIHSRLKSEGLQSLMVAQIHDELVFDCQSSEIEALSVLVRHEMESAYQMIVPLHVDIKVGKTL
ncbi:MAG: DNA polymerase [Firmicutes bacterium]|nr:DNA polymerase [Bacillota bacterium]